jgi:hypothetical protein
VGIEGVEWHLTVELGAQLEDALELLHVGAAVLLLLVHQPLLLKHPDAGQGGTNRGRVRTN